MKKRKEIELNLIKCLNVRILLEEFLSQAEVFSELVRKYICMNKQNIIGTDCEPERTSHAFFNVYI